MYYDKYITYDKPTAEEHSALINWYAQYRTITEQRRVSPSLIFHWLVTKRSKTRARELEQHIIKCTYEVTPVKVIGQPLSGIGQWYLKVRVNTAIVLVLDIRNAAVDRYTVAEGDKLLLIAAGKQRFLFDPSLY